MASCEYIPQELFECYTESCEVRSSSAIKSLESLIEQDLNRNKVYPVDDEDVPEDIKTADFDEVGRVFIVQPCPKPLTFSDSTILNWMDGHVGICPVMIIMTLFNSVKIIQVMMEEMFGLSFMIVLVSTREIWPPTNTTPTV